MVVLHHVSIWNFFQRRAFLFSSGPHASLQEVKGAFRFTTEGATLVSCVVRRVRARRGEDVTTSVMCVDCGACVVREESSYSLFIVVESCSAVTDHATRRARRTVAVSVLSILIEDRLLRVEISWRSIHLESDICRRAEC